MITAFYPIIFTDSLTIVKRSQVQSSPLPDEWQAGFRVAFFC